MSDIRELIPELSAWNNGAGIDVQSWISAIGRYDHAIGYATVFWPRFSTYDDCIFRHDIGAGLYQQWMDAMKGDKSAVEAAVNHQHIVDLFPNSAFSPSKDIVLYVGALLSDMWTCKLNREYPERRFEVRRPDGDAVELVDYKITFFQRR